MKLQRILDFVYIAQNCDSEKFKLFIPVPLITSDILYIIYSLYIVTVSPVQFSRMWACIDALVETYIYA